MKFIPAVSLLFCSALLSLSGRTYHRKIAVMNDGEYVLRSGKLTMEVNPLVGARIVSLKFDGYEFLTGRDIMEGNYGSTFWPSPQSSWGWPPPPVLDSDPYTASAGGDTATFVSWKDSGTGLQVVKKFFPAEMGRMNLSYTMLNVTDSVINVAPWEITRVHIGGLLFFPIGINPLGRKSFDPAPVKVVDGVAWYRDPMKRPEKNLLTTADGTEGWVAYAIHGKIFVKKFHNVPMDSVAPGEGEIAVYVSKEADYLELEIQGEYQPIDPGARTAWKVQWIARNIPKNISVHAGSGDLVKYVRKLVR
jgi:hypothetical protein